MAQEEGEITRRDLLTQSAAVVGVVAAAAGGATSAFGQAPAVRTARRFRGWVTPPGGGRSTLEVLKLKPISGRQVVVRTEASNLDAGFATRMVGLPSERVFSGPKRHMIHGHGGIGIVEAVGPEVRRVQIGDRVCVSGTPQCGACYPCMVGRSDMCQWNFTTDPNYAAAIAETRDGTPVYATSQIGGMAELMVTYEEWIVPIFTNAKAADLGITLGCTGVTGLGATTSQSVVTLTPSSVVAIVGCGPIGLTAVLGARAAGAATIIAIDPIRVRRELALKLGATYVLDPNAEGDHLVEKVHQLSAEGRKPIGRLWTGGTVDYSPSGFSATGADLVIEAAGATNIKPKVEQPPDPTGCLPIQQAYEMCSCIGHLMTTSVCRGSVSFPVNLFTIGGRTHHAGQAAGINPMRDIPRFVTLLERGQIDPRPIAERVVSLEDTLDAYEELAYRTKVGGVLIPA